MCRLYLMVVHGLVWKYGIPKILCLQCLIIMSPLPLSCSDTLHSWTNLNISIPAFYHHNTFMKSTVLEYTSFLPLKKCLRLPAFHDTMRPSIWPALFFHYWTSQYPHFSPQKYPGVLFENRVALNLMDYHHTFPLLMLFDGYLFTSLTPKKNFPGLSNTFPGQGCWLSASALQPRSSGIKDALFVATPVGFALSRELATISHSVAELDNSAHQALNCHGLDCQAETRRMSKTASFEKQSTWEAAEPSAASASSTRLTPKRPKRSTPRSCTASLAEVPRIG